MDRRRHIINNAGVARHMDYTAYMEATPDTSGDYELFMNLAAQYGINRFIFGTPFYDGTPVTPHAGLEAVFTHGDTLFTTPVGILPARPVEVQALTVKIFKNPCTLVSSEKGSLRLTKRTTGQTIVPHLLNDTVNAGTINLNNYFDIDSTTNNRYYRLNITTSRQLEIRTILQSHGDSMHLEQFDSIGAGTYNLDFPIFGGVTGRYTLMFRNWSGVNASYTINSFAEVVPNALDFIDNGDGTITFYGNAANVGYAGFPFLHARFHDPATLTRFTNQATALHNLLKSHKCYKGFWANGDELYCLQNEIGYQNIAHLVYTFIKNYSDVIYNLTKRDLGLWTLNYSANGYYANDWENGGILGEVSHDGLLQRLTGKEHIRFTNYEYGYYSGHYHAAEFATIVDKGYNKTDCHIAIGAGGVDTQSISWYNEITSLPASKQKRCGGVFLYFNNLAQATEANIRDATTNFPPLY